MKKGLLFAFILLHSGVTMLAQITTTALSGKVVSNEETILGATVVAIHEPSGTPYGTVTNADGRYNIQGMRVGGPYRVDISYIGYRKATFTDITLQLGENHILDATLEELSEVLDEVVITAYRPVAGTTTVTNIAGRQLSTLPVISRSITDFTKLSPFAGAGSSFAGRDGRYNYITVDGASLNNSFGLSSNNLPGGDAQPVSLDAIKEISINVSPFDVKYANFTGASVNAVTKSGDNQLKGSAYTFLRPQSFTGDKVGGGLEVPNAHTRSSYLYGFTLGGPLIKDKLFFFANAEFTTTALPGIEWRAGTEGVGHAEEKISRTTRADMRRMKDFLLTTYGYDPGTYEDFDRFHSDNRKFMLRMDWNISRHHKLTIRLNTLTSENDEAVNSNVAPNPRGSNRYSIDAMAFSNSNYKVRNIVTSATGELNSAFDSGISNKFLFTHTLIQDKRRELGSPFPFVDIYKDGGQYMSFGTELFTPHNTVENRVFSFIDNVNIPLGNHYLTAGASFEKQDFLNNYLRYAYGYYRYDSMDDFMNNARPAMFGLTYGYNGKEAPGAELAFGMGGLYVQDEWSLSDVFRLTTGLRLDMPAYLNDLTANTAIAAIDFPDNRRIDVSQWPPAKVMFSPRMGFRWDVKNDRSVIVSGGTGLFTGLLPFVWLINQAINSGVIQNSLDPLTAIPGDFSFYPDYKDVMAKYPTLFPSQPTMTVPGTIAFVDPAFKMPQVWRSSLGTLIHLPQGVNLSLNALYTRDMYNAVQVNINEKAPTARFSGNDNRPYYPAGDNRVHPAISSALMLGNGREKGYQYSLNAVVSRTFAGGFAGMLSYTWSQAKDLTANPGSVAATSWASNTAVGSLNDPGLSYSGFAVPHRLIADVSYEAAWLGRLKTTFSLFYTGSHTGRISYVYANDMNGDGNTSDLMYIPAGADELLFADLTAADGTVIYSKEAQAVDFWHFIESDPYLSSRKGQYAERFGGLKPWLNRFDFKVTQALTTAVGKRSYSLQLSLDILNVGNLLNPAWGTYKQNALATNYDNIGLLRYTGTTGDQRPIYRLAATGATDFADRSRWVDNLSTDSVWGMLLGIKILF